MTVGAWITLSLTILSSLVAVGALIYKYAQIVSDVKSNKDGILHLKEKHDADIKKLENDQKEYQKSIEKSVADIKELMNSMDKSLKILAVKFEYKMGVEDNGK